MFKCRGCQEVFKTGISPRKLLVKLARKETHYKPINLIATSGCIRFIWGFMMDGVKILEYVKDLNKQIKETKPLLLLHRDKNTWGM